MSDSLFSKRNILLATDSLHGKGVDSLSADSILLANAIPSYWNSDSLMASIRPEGVVEKKQLYTDIYKGHLLQPENIEPQLRNNVSPIWLFPALILILIDFTWLRVFYTKYFAQMLQAFSNNNLTNQIVRDENILVQRASVYLSFSFYLVAALFLYLVSIHYGWSMGGLGTGFSRFIFFAILVSAFYTLKFLILKFCGWLFDQDRETATYIFNTFLINNVLSIVMLPIIVLLAYHQGLHASVLITISLILVGLAFLYRIYRGILVGVNAPGFSPLYLFLYLCTLEIAPLVVLIRIVQQ